MLKFPRESVVEPQYLAIHVTYQCPARCGHCCFSSDIHKKGYLPLEDMLKAIDQAAAFKSLKLVGFTGGDPFLHQDILQKAISHAHSKGLRTRVVTSAYWAKSPDKADQVLGPLSIAGLNEMTVSYDDSHALYIPADNIKNAHYAAKRHNVILAINVCREPGSLIDEAYIREILKIQDDEPVRIQETWINSTGRANDEASELQKGSRRGHPDARLSPCQHVLRGPTITPTGKILPCCGTIPYRQGLEIGTINSNGVDGAIDNAYKNWVLKWIAFEGPAAVLEQITSGTNFELKLFDFDGNCQACDELFSNPSMLDLLNRKLPDKIPSLQLQEAIYHAAGLFRSPANIEPTHL